MNFTIEDILMYSLEMGYPNAVKACLLELPIDLMSMSTVCQVRLAVATLPQVITQSADAAQLISTQHMLNMSKILRSLKFIRSKCPTAGGCKSFCLAAIKLKKCIMMHFIYNENDESVLLSHLGQQFGENIVQDLMKPTQNLRLFNILKREVNHFTQLIRTYINDKESKILYLQTDVWREYNAQFWKDLHFDVVSYLNTIATYLPPLKIKQEASNSELYIERLNQSGKSSFDGISFNENCLLEFLQNITSHTDINSPQTIKCLNDTNQNMYKESEDKENNTVDVHDSNTKGNNTKSFFKKDMDQHLHSESCLENVTNFYGNKGKNEITPTCGYSEGLHTETVNKMLLQCPLDANQKKNIKHGDFTNIKRTLFSPVENSRPLKRRKLMCAEEAAKLLFENINSDLENSPCLSRQSNSYSPQEDAQIVLSFSDSKSTSFNSKSSDNTSLPTDKNIEPNLSKTQLPQPQLSCLRRSKNSLAKLDGPIISRCTLRSQTKSNMKSHLPHHVKEIPNATLSAPQCRERVVTRSLKKGTRRKLMYNLHYDSDIECTSTININESEFELEPLFTTHSSIQGYRNGDNSLEYQNEIDEEIIPESDYSDTESVDLSSDPYIPILSSNWHKDYSIQQHSPLPELECKPELSRLKPRIRFIDSLGCIAIENVLIQNPGDIECILNEK